MKKMLVRAWRWRLRTRRDYVLMTITLAVLSLVNLLAFGGFTLPRVVGTVLGAITAYWIISNLMPPKDGP